METPRKNYAKYINEELFRKYIRVLKLARTPNRQEFLKIAGVAAVGILIVGIIGFIIFEIMQLL